MRPEHYPLADLLKETWILFVQRTVACLNVVAKLQLSDSMAGRNACIASSPESKGSSIPGSEELER